MANSTTKLWLLVVALLCSGIAAAWGQTIMGSGSTGCAGGAVIFSDACNAANYLLLF